MASTTLVESKIEAGKKLIEALDLDGFPIRSAFWLYTADDDRWRLVIASSVVREHGPTEAYRRVFAVLTRLHDVPLSPSEISLVKDTEPLIEFLRKAVRVEGLSTIRFTRNTVSGVFIEDAVIYRST